MSHIHEKIDFTVEVFIVCKNKVLLRKHDKYNIWLGVGGHIELDEEPNEAALREVKEEVGLTVELLDTRSYNTKMDRCRELIAPRFLNIHAVSETHQHIALTYIATSKSDIVIPEKETDEWKWLTKAELHSVGDVDDHIQHYAAIALEEAQLAETTKT